MATENCTIEQSNAMSINSSLQRNMRATYWMFQHKNSNKTQFLPNNRRSMQLSFTFDFYNIRFFFYILQTKQNVIHSTTTTLKKLKLESHHIKYF